MTKTPEQLLAERTKRIKDAYELRVPDRVPIDLNLGYMLVAGFPVALLHAGTPDQIRALTKQLIEVVGKGSRFVMGASSSMAATDPALVKVWVDATKEYGVY